MMNKTAVEWLMDWMGQNQYFIGNDLLQAVEEAKQMEKEQIIRAYEYTAIGTSHYGEDYYNKTFKNEQGK